MQPFKRKKQICEHYLQGKCKFGTKCYKSHQTIQVHLIRHAQSKYNQILQEFTQKTQMQGFTEQAKHFQLDQTLIDCEITQKGMLSIQKFKSPDKGHHNKKPIEYDLLFVSPLERALSTADLLIKNEKIKAKNIIVLPRLTEVLSKVCDFSGSIQQKANKYKHFNFNLFRKSMNLDLNTNNMNKTQYEKNAEQERAFYFLKLSKQQQIKYPFIQNWQDQLISQVTQACIDQNQKFGVRYMKILKEVFPTPLQSSQDCFRRANLALKQVRSICQQNGAQKICLISHNRILKYVDGRWNRGRADSMGNCQLRITYI